jgi:hypothetical protein
VVPLSDTGLEFTAVLIEFVCMGDAGSGSLYTMVSGMMVKTVSVPDVVVGSVYVRLKLNVADSTRDFKAIASCTLSRRIVTIMLNL